MFSGIPPDLWDNCEDFGAVLKELRDKYEFKQGVLAKKLHISDTTLSRWEQGQLPHDFNLHDVRAIVSALRCTTQEYARLVDAFYCYVLNDKGFIDSGQGEE
jgi:transcriptional regulator with XRE-family HTH domain